MKSLIMATLLLALCGIAHAEKTIDELQSENYGFALNCGGELISSARYNWQKKLGIKLPNTGSFAGAASYFRKTSPHLGSSKASERLEWVTWHEGLQVVNESLGLPAKIDGCDVEVVWVVYGDPYQKGDYLIVGRKEYWEKLNPTDLFLVLLGDKGTKTTSDFAYSFTDFSVEHSRDWWAQYLQTAKDNGRSSVFVPGGFASNCELAPADSANQNSIVCSSFDSWWGQIILSDTKKRHYLSGTVNGAIQFDLRGKISEVKNFVFENCKAKQTLHILDKLYRPQPGPDGFAHAGEIKFECKKRYDFKIVDRDLGLFVMEAVNAAVTPKKK